MNIFKGQIYRHYKGGYYRIVDVGTHTESEELMVLYYTIDKVTKEVISKIWCRPISSWTKPVNDPKYPGAKIRFELVGDN